MKLYSILLLTSVLFISGCCCCTLPDGGGTAAITTLPSTTLTQNTPSSPAITVDEIKSGRALVCEFKNSLDGWDFTYKTKYPKVRVDHRIYSEGVDNRYTVLGDSEAIDWKGCTPYSEDYCPDEPELTEMYLLLENVPSYMTGVKPNTWYLTPLFHDFGDYDIADPESLIWLIELTESSPYPGVTIDCQWVNDIPDSEFELPAGVVPEIPV